jgi:RNA-directed DNA polymerase
LAVRKVTQDNQGKKTAGVDGVKSLNPKQRFDLAQKLGKKSKARALRRIWIPKPGCDEKRPLGIPTIKDRAEQALVKLVLEPQWEARFEADSYGFRPGRSAQDAIDAIFKKVHKRPNWVLDADIAKCFDQINHDYLLSKLDCPSVIKRKIKQWLKAGVLDNGVFEATEAGTPQGGVISPLLANIALHGMINSVVNAFPQKKNINGKREGNYRPKIIRYADDFVVLSPHKEVILEARDLIEQWLEPVGLKLKPEKIRICHTHELSEEGGEPGFDFLGFNIRHYTVGKYKATNTGAGKGLFQLNIKPSKKAVKEHYKAMKAVIRAHKTAPQYALIKRLNPVIKGWSNYYSTVVSKETFSKLDDKIWSALRAWTVSRCGKMSSNKLRKYYHYGTNGNWTFQAQDGLRLLKHIETPIKRHIKVKGDKSPFDGDWAYWSKRGINKVGLPTKLAKLLKEQKGRCNECGLFFTDSDLIEVDHIKPLAAEGKDTHKNCQALHRHCHDRKTARDLIIIEEYQAKISSHDKG